MAEANANRSASEDWIHSISMSTVKEGFGNFVILRLVKWTQIMPDDIIWV